MTYTIKTLNEKIAEIERDLSAYKMNFSDGAMGPEYEMK